MKQLVCMIILTLLGTVGTFTISPFLGIAVYYFLAILRPQYLWQWSLPEGVHWSYYVALCAVIAAAGTRFGLWPSGERQGRFAPRLTRTHMAVLAFGTWIGVTYLTAQNQAVAYPWFVEYLKLFVMFAVAISLVRTVHHVWILFCLAPVALGYIAYEINLLYLTTGRLTIQRDGYGGFDNNVAALMLAMGVPLCWFAWEGSRKRFRLAFLALIPVLLHAVLMTYSRGAMVALILVAPLIGLRSRHRRPLAIGGLAVALMLPVLAGPEIRERFFSIQSHEQDASAQERRHLWAAGWNIALDHPVFGVGVRNANLYSFQYGAAFEGQTIHSQYLQTAADNGFVGLGLYLTLLVLVWNSLNQVRREADRHTGPAAQRVHALAVGVECSLAVFCVGSIFLSLEVFELPYLLFLLAGQLEPMICPAGQPVKARPRLAVQPA